MAGDWIKMRKDLAMDPAVIGIACRLGMDEDTVVGKLHRLWSWADAQTKDGFLPNVSFEWVDRYLRAEKFSESLAAEGWIERRNGGIKFARFKRHNGESAKRRALTARRAVTHRQRKRNAAGVTKSASREEKIREEKSKGLTSLKTPLPPLPENLDTPEFRKAWESWDKHRSEIKKPLKPTQIAAQIEMLTAKGHDAAVAMIRHTVAKGWQGLRDPDQEPQRTGAANERPMLDPSIFGAPQ